jgi:hypothetical protein
MGVTAGIFLASILLKEMRYLVYKRYLWARPIGTVELLNETQNVWASDLSDRKIRIKLE